MSEYFKYWGKAQKCSDGTRDYHLLPYHCLDVAAVGNLLCKQMGVSSYIAERLDIKESDVFSFISFLCAIHDIGKFSDGFQNQAPGLVQKLRGISLAVAYQEKHWSSGYRFICKHTGDIFEGDTNDVLDCIDSWFSAVSGHHGKPPTNHRGVLPLSVQFPEQTAQDALGFIKEIKRIFNISGNITALFNNEQAMKETSWGLAGLMVLADWIGSNTHWFAYQQTEQALGEYWMARALPQADRAIAESGVLPKTPSQKQSFRQLFPNIIQQPTPLQNLVQKLKLSDKANLFIIEEITGAGKTEAALILAHRLMVGGCADGIYFGLPTMATANAMHDRMEEIYRKLYVQESNPSLILAHSASRQYFAMEQKEDDEDNDEEDAALDAKMKRYSVIAPALAV